MHYGFSTDVKNEILLSQWKLKYESSWQCVDMSWLSILVWQHWAQSIIMKDADGTNTFL